MLSVERMTHKRGVNLRNNGHCRGVNLRNKGHQQCPLRLPHHGSFEPFYSYALTLLAGIGKIRRKFEKVLTS